MAFAAGRAGRCSAFLLILMLGSGAAGGDWPTYNADAARSGSTGEALKLPLTKLWTYAPVQAPRPAWPQPGKAVHRIDFDYAFQPVAAEGRVFFGSSADDTVRALDAMSGSPVWRFTAGGPVRLAPTIHDGRCTFGSDDGWVYCLDAATGELLWKLAGGPRDERLLGNGRLISRWAVRTGVLVDGGVAYFAAGMWPREGVYVHAVDAKTGKRIWCNDRSGSMYIDQPHRGASAFTGVSPQGYLLASKDVLLVPTGRSVPAAYDRKTGRLLYYRPAESKFDGGCWATIAGELYLSPSHPRQLDDEAFVGEAQPREGDGVIAYELATGEPLVDMPLTERYLALMAGPTVYAVGHGLVQALDAAKLRGLYDPNDAARWTSECGRAYSIALAGGALLVGGAGTVDALAAAGGERLWRGQVGGQARGLAVADGRLIVATDRGEVTCFAHSEIPAPPRRARQRLSWRAAAPGAEQRVAAEIVRAAGARRGYAVIAGPDDARLAVALALRTDLHVIGLVGDDGTAAAERGRILTTDLYGSRVAVQAVGELASTSLPRYFADLVVVAPGANVAKLPGGALFRSVRPCGGVLCLAGLPAGAADRLVTESGAPLESVRAVGSLRLIRRGPLAGAGQWRYPWADGGRTGIGADSLVRLPLGLLWFGGPGPDRMMDRHWGTTAPLSVNGRVFVTGQHHVIALDAYNGREHWARPLPEAGRKGAIWQSGNMVADDDGLYVARRAVCHRLDQATGRSLAVYQMPEGLSRSPDGLKEHLRPVDVAWPRVWQVFGPVPKDAPLLTGPELKAVPGKLQAGGKQYVGRRLSAVGGVLDFTNLYGGFGFEPLEPGERPGPFPRGKPQTDNRTLKKAVYAFAEIDCPTAGRLTIGAGSDWWMAWFLDGKPLLDTLKLGNRQGPHQVTDYVFSTEVARGRHVLAVLVRSGSRGWSLISAGGAKYEPQLAEHPGRRPAAWGYLSAAGDTVLGTYVDPNDWSSEATALFALSRSDGAARWVHRPKGVVPNTSIAHGDGRVFLLDVSSREEIDKARRRGLKLEARRTLLALDLSTGKELWRHEGVPRTDWRMVQYARGVVVVCGTVAYDAGTGRELWHVADEEHVVERPPVICGRWVVTHPGACDLKTGRPRMVPDLLTGQMRPWRYVRAYGCGSIAGSRNLLFFRSGTAGFLDLARDGTTTFGAVRPGCSVNMVVAGGVLVMPESSSGCTCSYNFQTSVALEPVTGREDWYVFQGGGLAGPLRRLRLNLGAPGDRRDGEAAWLGLPRPFVLGAAAAPVEIEPADPNWTAAPVPVGGVRGGRPAWVYGSALALEGKLTVRVWAKPIGKPVGPAAATTAPAERSFTVRLHFAEPEHTQPGRRVFDVALQGRSVLEAFDIVRAAGGPRRAVVREFKGVKATEELEIALTSRTGRPLLCGLEILAE